MKAAVRSGYGSPALLRVGDVERPTPGNDEVLVRVYATTVSRTDCHVLSGRPFVMRLFTGLLRPRVAVTGSDFAGMIEAVGKHVQSFKVGARVMGFGGVFGTGSHAHYLAFPESGVITSIPDNLTYDQAAACVEGAIYAFNGVSAVNPRRGHTALVNGATGAIGSSMVQLLKYQGVSVTAVCRGEHAALVRSLGAERVIDYRTEDFTKDSRKYDLVLDAVGTSTFGKCKPILNDTGVYTSSGGFQNLFLALITPLLGAKKVVFPPPRGMRASLGFVRDLAEQGSFAPVIDRRYPLGKIAEAFEYVATGNKIGNVIITLDS
jgi:NADPH:quinone reductase-like Zn-dependent oxidoreductase